MVLKYVTTFGHISEQIVDLYWERRPLTLCQLLVHVGPGMTDSYKPRQNTHIFTVTVTFTLQDELTQIYIYFLPMQPVSDLYMIVWTISLNATQATFVRSPTSDPYLIFCDATCVWTSRSHPNYVSTIHYKCHLFKHKVDGAKQHMHLIKSPTSLSTSELHRGSFLCTDAADTAPKMNTIQSLCLSP